MHRVGPTLGAVQLGTTRVRAAARPGDLPVPLRVRGRGVAARRCRAARPSAIRKARRARALGSRLLPDRARRRAPGAQRDGRAGAGADVLDGQGARGDRLSGQRQDRDLDRQQGGRPDGRALERRRLLGRRRPARKRRPRPQGRAGSDHRTRSSPQRRAATACERRLRSRCGSVYSPAAATAQA